MKQNVTSFLGSSVAARQALSLALIAAVVSALWWSDWLRPVGPIVGMEPMRLVDIGLTLVLAVTRPVQWAKTSRRFRHVEWLRVGAFVWALPIVGAVVPGSAIIIAASALAALAHLRGGGTSGVFNCGYDHGLSVLEVIETVKRVSGRDFAVRDALRRPGDPAVLVADSATAQDRARWKPKFDNLETIVAHALAGELCLQRKRHGKPRPAQSHLDGKSAADWAGSRRASPGEKSNISARIVPS